MPADLCSHCLETEAALAERDREIACLRAYEEAAFNALAQIVTWTDGYDYKIEYIPGDVAVNVADTVARLRSREAKWRELLDLVENNAGGEYWLEEDEKRASQLRRELGLDGEGKA